LARVASLLNCDKKPAEVSQGGLFGDPLAWGGAELFDLRFLVHHMLSCLGIKLLDLHFLRHGFLIFCRSVEVAGARSGLQLDLFAAAFCHGRSW
jgi:hypothetical protein